MDKGCPLFVVGCQLKKEEKARALKIRNVSPPALLETQSTRRKDFFSFAAEKGGKRKTFSFAGAERNASLWDNQSVAFWPKA